MKWTGCLIMLAFSLSGCSSLPALAALIPAGAAAATGQGINVTVNIATRQTTTTITNCKCHACTPTK